VPPAIPAPELPETLGREEVLAVVSAGAGEVAACAQAHPSEAQQLVAVWTIRPDGSTAGVAVEPGAAPDAALARCVGERIARWRFPAHRAQMGPIRFPFSFASR
jgi:hypothetical protein